MKDLYSRISKEDAAVLKRRTAKSNKVYKLV